MTRVLACVGLALLTVVLTPDTALAQEVPSVANPRFFSWYPNYTAGLVIAGAAIFGALVVFTSIGGVLPGTEGRAKLDADDKRYEQWADRLSNQIAANPVNPQAIDAIGARVNEIRDDIRDDKRNQFAVGAVLYVILGTFVALALAQDWLTAIAISAGWTGLIGTFGLKGDFSARSALKNEVIADLEGRAQNVPANVQDKVEIAKAV